MILAEHEIQISETAVAHRDQLRAMGLDIPDRLFCGVCGHECNGREGPIIRYTAETTLWRHLETDHYIYSKHDKISL